MSVAEVIYSNIPQTEINIEKGCVFSFPTHTHSHFEMTMYEPFSGGVTVNGEYFAVEQPTVFLISPSDFHRISVDGESSSVFVKIGFNENLIGSFSEALPSHPIILRGTQNHKILTALFEEIYENRSDKNYVSVLTRTAMVYLMRHGITISPAIQGKKHELAVKALRYINKNFTADISLLKAAEHFSVSPQYLSSVFASEVGNGFSSYLSTLRLKRAVELLESSDLNITEICFASGYRNLSHFLRAFKKHFGLSPKEFRKQNTK